MRTLTIAFIASLALTGCAEPKDERQSPTTSIEPDGSSSGGQDPAVAGLVEDCEESPDIPAPKDNACTAITEYDGYALQAALFNNYVETLDQPEAVEYALDLMEYSLTDGNKVRNYKTFDTELADYATYCIVHPTGAWALFDTRSGLSSRGTTAATCEFLG